MYILFVTIIHVIYKSKRFEVITNTEINDPINSIQDIMDLNMTVFIQQQINPKNFPEHSFKEYINSHGIYCNQFEACLNKTAHNKHFAMIGSLRAFEWFMPVYIIDDNLVRILDYHLNSFTLSFYFTKGHPIFEEFNYRLSLLAQHGLIEYSYKQAKQDVDKFSATVEPKKEFIAKNVCDYFDLFVTYFIGNFIAVVVLCLEYFRII